MRILISAYACNPYGGSEPGVGWAAVCQVANEHEVFVLTDIHNRAGWEKAREEGRIPETVRVRFIRDRAASIRNSFIAHIGSWLSYAAYNRQVLKAALEWHREVGFDLCHQVTIAAWRMPSPLWRLPIPFVWGPVGGAGHIPRRFRRMLSGSARMFEIARDIQTFMALRSRAFRDCVRESAVVIAANEETERLLQPFREESVLLRLPVYAISREKADCFLPGRELKSETGPLRLFAGGNMEGRKGGTLALRALARVLERGVDFHFTIAGGGPDVGNLMVLTEKLGLGKHVTFHPGYRGEDYVQALQTSDVYLLPSFRETFGMTLAEAILAGCYPVVADTSAQGEMIRMVGGTAVPATDMESLTEGLANAIQWCAGNRKQLKNLAKESAGLIQKHYSMENYISTLRAGYAQAIEAKRGGKSSVIDPKPR